MFKRTATHDITAVDAPGGIAFKIVKRSTGVPLVSFVIPRECMQAVLDVLTDVSKPLADNAEQQKDETPAVKKTAKKTTKKTAKKS